MFLPLSLYLKTWGRQGSGEARGWGQAECVAWALMLTHTALAQQLLQAWLRVTPQ